MDVPSGSLKISHKNRERLRYKARERERQTKYSLSAGNGWAGLTSEEGEATGDTDSTSSTLSSEPVAYCRSIPLHGTSGTREKGVEEEGWSVAVRRRGGRDRPRDVEQAEPPAGAQSDGDDVDLSFNAVFEHSGTAAGGGWRTQSAPTLPEPDCFVVDAHPLGSSPSDATARAAFELPGIVVTSGPLAPPAATPSLPPPVPTPLSLSPTQLAAQRSTSTMRSSYAIPIQSDSDGDEEGEVAASPLSGPPTARRTVPADFEFRRCIGKGGFGKVYLAVDRRHTGPSPAPPLAIKVFRKDFLLSSDSVSYTRAERDNLLAAVDAPFIVKLLGAFQCDRRCYLVMEYINGGQLLGVLREQVMLSEAWVTFYGAEVLAAIGALHSAGIVHRDLKPENILLDSEGHVVLTDFGFSKVLADGERTRSFCGTFEYMAPETISEASHSFEADYWSLGILLFDLLTGRPPFRGTDEDAMRSKVMSGRIKYPKYLTGHAISLLKKLLQRDVSRRLANLEEAKAHPFFESVDWAELQARRVPPPYRPPVSSSHDTSMYDEDVVGLANAPSSPADPIVAPEHVEAFKDFSFAASPGKYMRSHHGVPK